MENNFVKYLTSTDEKKPRAFMPGLNSFATDRRNKPFTQPERRLHAARYPLYTRDNYGRKPRIEMLDHLIDYTPPMATPQDVTPLEKAAPDDIVAAQVSTAEWLKEMGATTAEESQQAVAASQARQAFQAMTTQSPEEQRKALVQMKTPPAVQHLTGMLVAYDWEFVQQAKELRGYAVAQILEETKHPDAKIRLKALDMLGRVTEVALFTERVEVKKSDLTDAEIEAKIKDKINRFMNVTDVIDVSAEEPDPAQPTDEPPSPQ